MAAQHLVGLVAGDVHEGLVHVLDPERRIGDQDEIVRRLYRGRQQAPLRDVAIRARHVDCHALQFVLLGRLLHEGDDVERHPFAAQAQRAYLHAARATALHRLFDDLDQLPDRDEASGRHADQVLRLGAEEPGKGFVGLHDETVGHAQGETSDAQCIEELVMQLLGKPALALGNRERQFSQRRIDQQRGQPQQLICWNMRNRNRAAIRGRGGLANFFPCAIAP
ncbi:MAG: hypothetical protein NTW37_16130 [Proteobacteria bacterium]|nr:hypothetical protein [Pseudomonadota bacterium]